MFSVNPRQRAGELLTIKEAAVLAAVTEKTIRHEMASKIVRPARRVRKRVELDPGAVFYFSLVSRLPVELNKEDRRDLFDLITHGRSKKGHWKRESGRFVLTGPVPVVLPTSELDRFVADRLRLFAHGKGRIVTRPDVLGGEPVFEGTRISVRHVGALARKGIPAKTLREDFPRLSGRDIEFARIYIELGKPPGRPRKLKFVRS